MRFKNKPTPTGNDSFQQPPAGKYLGVLQGFCFVGLQPGGQFDPREALVLRWELHSRKGPVVDGEGRIYTANQTFSATVRGEKSNLHKCLKAHGIDIAVNEDTDSHEWIGAAAWIRLEKVTSKKGKEYTNIVEFSGFDPEADGMDRPTPSLKPDHWEPADKCACPSWATYWVDQALDDTRDYGSEYRPPKDSPNGEKKETVAIGSESDGDENDIPF